jgi:transposase InsO family protein
MLQFRGGLKMPWKVESVMDQRVEFVLRALKREASISRLCREYGISRPTGYLWLHRYRAAGSLSALGEHSRRPHHSPRQTSAELAAQVLRLRDEKGWGARKLHAVLGREGVELPARTIHRILRREGRVSGVQERRQASGRFARRQCNELLQMDFKGEYRVREGKCYPLTLLDDCSRYLLGLWPLGSTRASRVHEVLQARFREHGVPQAVLMDHGTPWYSMTNARGLTWLSVWLIKHEVRLYYSGIHHPQTQGKVERLHRSLNERTRHRGLPQTLTEWKAWAEEFRREYNEQRPHEALGMRTPAEVYVGENLRPYQEQVREWEYGGGQVRRLNTRGLLYYRGRHYFVCEALAGERVRLDELDDQLVVSYRLQAIREIELRTGRSRALRLRPAHSNKGAGEAPQV